MITKLANIVLQMNSSNILKPKYYYAAPESTKLINVYILLH